MRFFLVAALWAAVLHAEDITVPLDDGSILIRPQFIRVNQFGNYIPELSVKLKNQTSHPWRTIKLQFEIGGFWRVDLEKQLQEIKAKRDAEEAAQAEEERVQAEKDAAAAARKKRLSSERRKKEAEEQARYAKAKADEAARVRAACAAIYKNTANKKVSDLTVKEAQQVQTCQVLGLYPPD